MSVRDVVAAGPLLLAVPVALAAGVVSFASPCILPLAPGYLSYLTGLTGSHWNKPAPHRAHRPSPRPRPLPLPLTNKAPLRSVPPVTEMPVPRYSCRPLPLWPASNSSLL